MTDRDGWGLAGTIGDCRDHQIPVVAGKRLQGPAETGGDRQEVLKTVGTTGDH